MKEAKIKDLLPDDRNMNKGTEYGNSLIENSLRKFGAGRSILIDKNNRIIAGNKTIENASQIGIEDIIIVETDGHKIVAVKRNDIDLDTQLGRELALADNATSKANIAWDEDELKAIEEDFMITAADWGVGEFDLSLENKAEEDDYEMPEEIKTDIVVGDLFEIGQHRLLCGDSTDSDAVAKLMNGEKADMVFTDPPYNVNYGADINNPSWKGNRTIQNDKMSGKDFEDFIKSAFANVKLFCDGVIYCFGAQGADGRIMFTVLDNMFHNSGTIIWVKDSLVLGRGKYHTKYEPCWFGWNKSGATFTDDRTLTNVWECKRPKVSDLHPTMKPIELISMGLNHNPKAKSVLDLFLGSGSTMVAAHQLNRKCYGMELDPKYCQVIIDRMKKLDPDIVIKKNGEIIS